MNAVWQPGSGGARSPANQDLVVALLAALVLLCWDAKGADLVVVRWFGAVDGFQWRDGWLTSLLLHQGGRALGLLVMGLLLLSRRRPFSFCLKGLSPAARWQTVAAVWVCLIAVLALKQFSNTSCPWDLREFGGVAVYVSHWNWGVSDGGPGRCLPSGHAVTAFAFLPVYFAVRRDDAGLARVWLAAICMLGALFGVAQLLRGAHYPSHTLWSAWICWVLAAAGSRFSDASQRPRDRTDADQHHGAEFLLKRGNDRE